MDRLARKILTYITHSQLRNLHSYLEGIYRIMEINEGVLVNVQIHMSGPYKDIYACFDRDKSPNKPPGMI